MAKAFTPEQREELNKQIVELVRLNGRGTVRQLADETGISRCAVSRLSRELAASGDLYIWLRDISVCTSTQGLAKRP